LFVPGEGRVIIAGDFAQMELRAGCHVSKDSAMRDAFVRGVDLHRLTASRMMRKAVEQVTDDERSFAKPINFGALFGERERGLIESAWKDYGLILTHDEAHEWLIVFVKTYPEFAKWRYNHYEACKAAGCIVIGRDAAQGIGRLFPLSRLLPGESAYTRSCNMPIQGGCGDASMIALTSVDQTLTPGGYLMRWVDTVGLCEGQAEERQKSSPGVYYVGAAIQHMVGAKLDCALSPGKFEHNSYSTSDQQTGRR
jgi:DNA polymerase I-like protein with 3'-5' exonuclease and polymerase domains